ncbi:MAG TPA: single-stranded-DNA-specific exonuclease RecJ [Solirubrobacteraceae bacterium]|nr:single-stranded-DNA-specific exonuclease RecJ [Solirubrobacteraceae bacterium]
MSEAALAAHPVPPSASAQLRVVPAAAPQRPVPRLELSGYDLAAALTLERQLSISHPLAQVLVRRGLDRPELVRDFLVPREAHPPSAFAGIATAVELIERHLRSGSRITVHGDYDVDGVCATAIMVRALRSLGADVDWFLPSRLEDGYGVSPATIDRLAARGTGLLITVDCGITAVAELEAALASGIEVVVTDHHAPRIDGTLPPCPVVHPSVCGYPCAELCGTGVAFKLAQALGAETAGETELVALATVADLMPLTGENRRLVREGIAAMASTARPGLRALMEVARVDPSAVSAHALGFRLAPRINAAGRLRRADAGLELLLTEDQGRAREIASELDAVNAERRAIEQRTVWEADAQIAELGERSAYVLAAAGWHPGVVGIVASRVVERHHRPAILIGIDEDGIGHGSGRSIPGFDLLSALHVASGELERYGGHRAAAGLTVRRERIDALRAAVEAHASTVLTPELLTPVERVDAVVCGSELGLALAEELQVLEPCGIGNPGARLLVPGARFEDLRAIGEGRHARFSVRSGGAKARAVAFGCDGRLAVPAGQPADATFRLEVNAWNGIVEPRLVLREAQPCAPRPIEVLGEDEGYLAAALAELDRPLAGVACPTAPSARVLIDRRGASPLAVLTDALAAGGAVLAVCADVPRRLDGLRARAGGFVLAGHHALERDPDLAGRFAQIVALDPPSDAAAAARLRAGSGYTHMAWGEPELRFAQQMHELEYGLRASLVALYRGVRLRGRVAGGELERLLRGDGPHVRPPRLAGRLIRVLAELELVSLDRDLPALTIAGTAQTALERSPSYRAYRQRYEDGRRYLSSANLRPGG